MPSFTSSLIVKPKPAGQGWRQLANPSSPALLPNPWFEPGVPNRGGCQWDQDLFYVRTPRPISVEHLPSIKVNINARARRTEVRRCQVMRAPVLSPPVTTVEAINTNRSCLEPVCSLLPCPNCLCRADLRQFFFRYQLRPNFLRKAFFKNLL